MKLQKTTKNDLETLFLFQTDPEGIQMAAFTSENPSDKEAYLKKWTGIVENPAMEMYTIWDQEEIVGSVVHFTLGDRTYISYWIDRKHWGKGVASWAVKEFITIAKPKEYYAHTAFDNIGSQKVLERIGFQKIEECSGFANARQEEIVEFVYTYKK